MNVCDLMRYISDNKLESMYNKIMVIAGDAGIKSAEANLFLTYIVNEYLKKTECR